jgi:hypothetical protein
MPASVSFSFPILQYFPLYLLGMYAARHNLRPHVLIGLAGIAAFYIYDHFVAAASRFPPDVIWIAGSAFFTIAWYAAARFLNRAELAARLLIPIGQNALFYLLTSNILVFAASGPLRKSQPGLTASLAIGICILGVIYFMTLIVRRLNLNAEPGKPEPPTGTSGSG